MNTARDTIHPLCVLLHRADISTRSYSGRGMYGRECLGVEVNSLAELLSVVIAEATDDNREEIAEAFAKMKTDSMGLGTIVYFPGVAFADLDEEQGPAPAKTCDARCKRCAVLADIQAAKEDETLSRSERADFIEDARGELSGLPPCKSHAA